MFQFTNCSNEAKYTYDSANPNPRSRGNLLQVRRKIDMAAADNNTNDIVTAMTYEPLFNQIDTISDPKGNTTAYTYDHELNMAHPKYGGIPQVFRRYSGDTRRNPN